jgi:hypothetical protein
MVVSDEALESYYGSFTKPILDLLSDTIGRVASVKSNDDDELSPPPMENEVMLTDSMRPASNNATQEQPEECKVLMIEEGRYLH